MKKDKNLEQNLDNSNEKLHISDVISSKIDKPKIRLSIISTKHKQWKNNFIREGYCFSKYRVGENFRIVNDDREIVFSSTPIVEIIDCDVFKTINTEYKIEYI
jgi:hypothetical protein